MRRLRIREERQEGKGEGKGREGASTFEVPVYNIHSIEYVAEFLYISSNVEISDVREIGC